MAPCDGIVKSGEYSVVKPNPAIYRLSLDQYGSAAAQCLFIDDSAKDVADTRAVGMQAPAACSRTSFDMGLRSMQD
jgi:2-haloacid dehalogenase